MPDFDTFLTSTTMLAFVVTVALAFLSGRLRQRRNGSAVTEGIAPATAVQTTALPVVSLDPDLVECVRVSRHIADLMIAEEWTEIADTITEWESRLCASPGGRRYHDVAADTCLSGLQGLLEDMPRNALSDLEEATTELGHFMDTLRQAPENHIFAMLAARAHIAIGEACRADEWPEELHKAVWRRMAQHFIAAGEILADFDPLAHMSPLLSEANYLQALGAPGGSRRLQNLFEDWIELDPSNSDIYGTHTRAMVAREAFTGDDILREADAAMARTEDTLGFGGYALFFMPLLAEYESARELLDAELYAAALLDLASHSATQADVNLASATLLAEIEEADEFTATAFRDTLIIMIRQNLEVIYPRFWPISIEDIQALVTNAAETAPDIFHAEDEDFEFTQAMTKAA